MFISAKFVNALRQYILFHVILRLVSAPVHSRTNHHRSESGFCHLHRSLADVVRRVVYQGQRPPRLPWPENTQALWQISENAGTGYSSAAMESPSKKNESRHASAHRRSIFQQLTARMKNARLKAQSKKNDASLRKQEGGRLQERIDRALEGKRLHRSLKQ